MDVLESNPTQRETLKIDRTSRAVEIIIYALAILSLCYSLWAVRVGWGNGIFEFHGFRQSQTAITAYSILHGGPILHYETPVLGPPWSVPFEFPLYQLIVARIAGIFSTPLDQTGRFVAVFFYYLSFFLVATILSGLGYKRIQLLPVLALFAASPFYIFISRLFMIESTALFFSLLYVDQMLRLSRSERTKWTALYIAAATVAGVLAGLVKVTTFAPFLVLGAGLVFLGFWRERKAGSLRIKLAATICVSCMLLPVVATDLWTKFADAVKSRNPIGIGLTSKALTNWNFGTLAQRLHPSSYIGFATSIHNIVGNLILAFVILAVAVRFCPQSLKAAAICFALYAGTIEVFFHLHMVHIYYAYANGIFVVAGVGLLLGQLVSLPGRRAWLGVVLLAVMLVCAVHRYFYAFYPIQSWNAPSKPRAAALVDATTQPGDVILITGLNWSSEFPYQSHRRAIMELPGLGIHRFDQSIANQGAAGIAAVVACEDGRSDPVVPMLLAHLSMPMTTALHADNCDIYER